MKFTTRGRPLSASHSWLWAAAFAGLFAGCAGAASEGTAGSSPENSGNRSDDGNQGSADAAAAFDPKSPNGSLGGSVGSAPVVPEKEVQVEVEVPRAGARFVYAANTKRDTVAVIDSTNLSIRTAEVGDKPSFLATVPGQDIAMVINAGSADLSIVRSTAAGSEVKTVPVGSGSNRISVAPNGAYAIAWYDSRLDGGIGGATGSFQDITLVRLAATGDSSLPLTVGFRPNSVAFSSDGTSAFVVTEDGVSIIRFAQITMATVLPLVPLGPVSAQGATDVSITPDGKFALARKDNSGVVSLVDLVTGIATSVDLGSPVTDLDLSPNGSMAIAVMRDVSKMVTLPLPLGFTSEPARIVQTFTDEKVGSAVVAPNGLFALLYTTVGNIERALVASVDGTVPARPVLLRKAVRAVTISPDSATAMVLHEKVAGDPQAAGIDVDLKIDRSFGYSVVKLASGFAKLQLTDVDPGPMAIVPDSSRAFLLLRDDKRDLRMTQQVDLSSLVVSDYIMGSPPLSLAVLSGTSKVFVSQVHPSGRLSFIDWTRGTVESVTGFELNGGIKE
jgi:DNA-binding beta-propeller fold protein YncE